MTTDRRSPGSASSGPERARPTLLLFLLMLLEGCAAPEDARTASPSAAGAAPPPHELTEIPIDINTLTEEQRESIRLGHESDTSPT